MRIGILCNGKMSLPSLQHLVQMGHQLSIIIPDQQIEDHFQIESFAMSCNLPLFKVNKKTLTEQILNWKITYAPDFIFVITFPYILAEKFLDRIKLPVFNFHFAPLPEFRGAQPVFWLIKNGEQFGGIGVHLLTREIDAGPIIHFEKYLIRENETFGSYMLAVAQLNVQVITEVIKKVSKPNWHTKVKKQNKLKSKNWSKPGFQDIIIHWDTMTAKEIENLCRACNPWNKGAITQLNGLAIKLLEVSVLQNAIHQGEPPGSIILQIESNRLAVSTMDKKYLDLEIVYLEEEGFWGNNKLQQLGIKSGFQFSS